MPLDEFLPASTHTQFSVDAFQLDAYLRSVGGGHPVHTSIELAQAAGFANIPVPGVQAAGAALASFTRLFGDKPIQLLQIDASFKSPIYVGDEIELRVRRSDESMRLGTQHVSSKYIAEGRVNAETLAIVLTFILRMRIDP